MRAPEIVKVIAQGPQGPAGPVGSGIPSGGTTGQTLAKASDNDYDTIWSNAGAGSVTSIGLTVPSGLSVSGSPITASPRR